MVTVYGIKNCDTVKNARRWLDDNKVAYRFHDLRADGLEPTQLRVWFQQLGWGTLLNRRGTTWRQLPESAREDMDETRAIALVLEHPALLRRPLLDLGDTLHVGFDPDSYASLLRSR